MIDAQNGNFVIQRIKTVPKTYDNIAALIYFKTQENMLMLSSEIRLGFRLNCFVTKWCNI